MQFIFPEAPCPPTRAAASSAQNDWGAELYGRYISVQEPGDERVQAYLGDLFHN